MKGQKNIMKIKVQIRNSQGQINKRKQANYQKAE